MVRVALFRTDLPRCAGHPANGVLAAQAPARGKTRRNPDALSSLVP